MRADYPALRLLSAVVAGYTIAWAPIWAQPILLTEVLQMSGVDAPHANLILTAEIVSLALASVLCAQWLKGQRLRTVLVLGTLTALLANGVALVRADYDTLLITRIIAGLGEGAVLTATYAVLMAFADQDKACAQMALFSTLIAMAMVYVMPSLGQQLAGRQTLPALIGLSCMLLPLLAWMPAALRFAMPASRTVATPTSAGTWSIWAAAVLFMVMNATVWPVLFLLGLEHGLSAAAVNRALVLSMCSSIVGSLLVSLFAARHHRLTLLALGLCGVAVSIMLLIYTHGPLGYWIGINLNTLASYFAVPFFTGAAADHDPSGRGVALIGSAGPLAYAAGVGLSGVVWAHVDRSAIPIAALIGNALALLIITLVTQRTARRALAARLQA